MSVSDDVQQSELDRLLVDDLHTATDEFTDLYTKESMRKVYELGKRHERANAPQWHDAPTCAGLWMAVNEAVYAVHIASPSDVLNAWDGYRYFGPIPDDPEAKHGNLFYKPCWRDVLEGRVMWRTDFENMPRDGSEFFAMVLYGDKVCPEVIYRHYRCVYADCEDEPIAVRNCELVRSNDPDLTTLVAPQTVDTTEPWYATFWYTEAGSVFDGEHGGTGDSAIQPDHILMWALPPEVKL